ncbi:quorum-sensing CAI-1 autoinducer sensor kinase/phosphatase CqsS [Vibrio cholerae]|uniref:quorum-sensing CAI-1 autoinducer sensor kinase/phosphatase CqsS n=1 Tax=Vibrio cholerae TaxID=666 RepID=UPI001D321A20|nr:quorum-sensing CAI-1 autoinducer sensor kinase/phosphatase CqsS [Vibrio cholerae]MBA8611138.1 response regulator [Vibrio cholerae]
MIVSMDVIKRVYQYAEPNLSLVGWMGMLGFPAYYFIWEYWFPQSYENLGLRCAAAVLFGGLVFRDSMPNKWQRYMPGYFLFTIGFCLPFFFAFMMLMNDWSTIWAMSFMASIFLHILLVHDTRVMALQALFSVLVAYLAVYGLTDFHPTTLIEWQYIPIFLFTYVFGNLCFFRNQISHETKVSIAKTFGAGIAHEMRNPLSALKTSIDVVRTMIPKPQTAAHTDYSLDAQELDLLHQILNEADDVIYSGNNAIDLLLTSIDENRVSPASFKKHSVVDVIEKAVKTFPYKNAADQHSVELEVHQPFDFFGSDTLLTYALFNLLKNAFYYQKEHFSVRISIEQTREQNLIRVRDNGVGIAPEMLEDIFRDFYTFGKNGSYGLGLPFCRKVMTAFGGTIRCASQQGQWTEFVLSFPRYDSDTVNEIKTELLKTKSLIYIGSNQAIVRELNQLAVEDEFGFTAISAQQAVRRQDYEFEFDLILLDLDDATAQGELLPKLEGTLSFAEGCIGYVYDPGKTYAVNINRYLRIQPISIHSILRKPRKIIERLLFEQESLSMNRNVIPLQKSRHERRILVVDDNQSIRTFTAILLEQQGYEVVQANDGSEVLKHMESQNIDLVLMDIEMPNVGGLEATRLIRDSEHEYKNIPIIGYTGDNSPKTLALVQTSGMNDFIVKPADRDVLLNKVAAWV